MISPQRNFSVGNWDPDSAGMPITCPEEGAVALALCVIRQALDDIRLHLDPPPATNPNVSGPTTRAAVINAKARAARRAAEARQAAAFLSGESGRLWIEALTACGVQVPLPQFYRELRRLKTRASRQP